MPTITQFTRRCPVADEPDTNDHPAGPTNPANPAGPDGDETPTPAGRVILFVWRAFWECVKCAAVGAVVWGLMWWAGCAKAG